MPSRTAAAIATGTLALATLASGASAAAAAAPAVLARAAAVDRCSYQVVRSDDSRYAYSVSAVSADGSTRALPLQKEDVVRIADVWRTVMQVDACAGGQGRALAALRVTGKLEQPEHYEPSVPRTIRSGDIEPATASVIPKAPALKSVERLQASTVRVTWEPAQGNPDEVLLMETKPFYSSEVGIWHPYTFQRNAPAGATSMDRKLERDPGIPANVRAHSYCMRAVKDGFVSDLRAEKPVTVEP